jgi:hypothetical protein
MSSRRGTSPLMSPYPFWTKPIISVGLFYLTTIQA